MNTLLDELVEVLPNATRYSDYISSLCPFHDDTRPSFMVWQDTYKCYACGAFGNTQDLLSLASSGIVKSIQAARFNNPWRKWIKKYGRIGLAMREAHKNLPQEYLTRRGIRDAQQCKLKLGFLDDFGGWYTFPMFDRYGTILGGIARKSEDNPSPAKYVTPPAQNNRHTIYVPDWELVDQQSRIVMTFGIVDAITLALNDIAAISIIGLFVDPAVFDQFRKAIYIVPDRKEERFAIELASRLGWRGHVLRFKYPDGTKDLNDLALKDPKFIPELFKDMRNGTQLAGLQRNRNGASHSEKDT